MHTFSHIHFPTYIFPHTYTFFTYIFHIQMYVCDPKFHTYIHFGKNMYVPHTYVYVCKMFTDICSHTLVCTTLISTSLSDQSSGGGLQKKKNWLFEPFLFSTCYKKTMHMKNVSGRAGLAARRSISSITRFVFLSVSGPSLLLLSLRE